MKVCCTHYNHLMEPILLSTHNTPLSIKKTRKSSKIIPATKMSAAMFFWKGLKNEFEIAMVNKPSAFK